MASSEANLEENLSDSRESVIRHGRPIYSVENIQEKIENLSLCDGSQSVYIKSADGLKMSGGSSDNLYGKMYASYKKKDFDGIKTLVLEGEADINHIFTESFVDVTDRGLALLHFIALKGNCARMKVFIDFGADPCIPTTKGETPLHLSCKRGHFQCVDFLIQCYHGLVNQQNLQGLTPLMKAIYRFDTAFKEKDFKKTIDLLINAGCDVNICPESKITPLHVVSGKWKSVKMVEKLIQAGANVNADTGSSTPLLTAVCRQRIDSATVIALVDAGANVNYRIPSGKSVLHIAVSKSEDISVEHLLKAGADPNIEDQDGNSPLWIAVSENNIKIAPLLLAHGAKVNFCNNQHNLSLLVKATMNQNVKMVKLLLENNANVNMTTDLGASALHYAVDYGNLTITKLLLSKNCELEKYCSFRNLYNPQNVLQMALEDGNSDMIKLLLIAGFPLFEHYIKFDNLADAVKDDAELLEWIYDFFYTPQTLQHLTSLSVRRYLGCNLTQTVDALTKNHSIPQTLADIIHLKHLLDECKQTLQEFSSDDQY